MDSFFDIPNRIQSLLESQSIQGNYLALIFGSFCCRTSEAKDIDLLLIYECDSIDHVLQFSTPIKFAFEKEFGIPLHLLRITWKEACECKEIISEILSKPFIII